MAFLSHRTSIGGMMRSAVSRPQRESHPYAWHHLDGQTSNTTVHGTCASEADPGSC